MDTLLSGSDPHPWSSEERPAVEMAMTSIAEPAAASQTSHDPDLRNVFSLFPFNKRPGFAAESSIEPSRHPDSQDSNPANNAASSDLLNDEKRTKIFSWDDIGRKSRKAKDDGIFQRRINQIQQEEITKSFEINANDKSKGTTAKTVSGSIYASRPLTGEGARNGDKNSPEWKTFYEENFFSIRTPQKETKLERRNRLRREKRRSRRQQAELPRRPSLIVQLPLPHGLRGVANSPLLENELRGSEKIASQWIEGELIDNGLPPRLSRSSDSGISVGYNEATDRQSSAGLPPSKIIKLRLSSNSLASWSPLTSEADAPQYKVDTVLEPIHGTQVRDRVGVPQKPIESTAQSLTVKVSIRPPSRLPISSLNKPPAPTGAGYLIPNGDIEGTALLDQRHAKLSGGGEVTATTLPTVTKTSPEDNSEAPKTADVSRVIEVITLEDSDNEATASRTQVVSKKSMPKSTQSLESSRPNTSALSSNNLTEEKSNYSSPAMFEPPFTSSVMGSNPAQNSPSAVPMRSPPNPVADLSKQSRRQLSVASTLSSTEEMPNPPNSKAAVPGESPAKHDHSSAPKRVAQPSQQTGSQLPVASTLSSTAEMSNPPNSLVSAQRNPPAKHGHPSPPNPVPQPCQQAGFQFSTAQTLTPTREIANPANAVALTESSVTHGHLSPHIGVVPPRPTHVNCSWVIAPKRSRAGSASVAKKIMDLQSQCLVPNCRQSFDSFQELRMHLKDDSLHNRRQFTLSHSEGGCRIDVSRVGSTGEAPLFLESTDRRTTSASAEAIPRREDRAPPSDVSIPMLEAAVRGYPPLNTAHSITNAPSTTLGSVIANPLQAISTPNGISAIGNTKEQLTTEVRISTPATSIANEVGSNIDQVISHRAASSESIEGQHATSTAPVTSATGGPSAEPVARPESRQVTPAERAPDERASAVPKRNRVTSSTPLPLSTPSLPVSSQPTGGRSAPSTDSGKKPPDFVTCYWWILNEKDERVRRKSEDARCDICSATFSDFRNLRNHLKTKDSHTDRSIKITYCEGGNNCVIWVKLALVGEPPFGTKDFVEDYQNFKRAWGWLRKPGEQSSSAPSTPVVADAPNFFIQQLPQLLQEASAAPNPTSEALRRISFAERSASFRPKDYWMNLVYWDLDDDLRAKSSRKKIYKTYKCIVCNKDTFRTWKMLQRHLTKDKEHEGHTVICGDSRNRAKHSVTLRKALSTQSAPEAKAAHIPPASTNAESARFEDDSVPPITSTHPPSPLLPQALVGFDETVATENTARETISPTLRRSWTAPWDLPAPQPANEEHPAAAPTTAAQHISDVVMSSQGPKVTNDALAKMNTVARPPTLRTKENVSSMNTDTHDDTIIRLPLDTHEPIPLYPKEHSATIQSHNDLTHHNKGFRDDDKDFMVFWDPYILGKPGRGAIHSRMPKILKDFVLTNWVWLHERPSRVSCYLKQITALMVADKITPEVGREAEMLLRPPQVPEEAWNRVERGYLWTREALKQNRKSWAALWDSLLWQEERTNGAARTPEMHQTLDQFINVAGHLLVKRDQNFMNKTILKILHIMVNAPDRVISIDGVPIKYGDMNALNVVQLLHSLGKRGANEEWSGYLQARMTIDADMDAEGEPQGTEDRMKALLLNHPQHFAGPERSRWRRYHEVELHLLYLAGSLTSKSLLRQLEDLRTLGMTPDPEAHPKSHPRVQETPVIEPASLPNVPPEERRLPTQKAVNFRGKEECKCGLDVNEFNFVFCANRTSRTRRCPHPAYHFLCVDVGRAFKDGCIAEEVWFCEGCRRKGWDRPECPDADEGVYKQDDDDNDEHGPSYATPTNASKDSISPRIHDTSGQQHNKNPNTQPRRMPKMTSMEEAQLAREPILTNDESSASSSSQAVAYIPHFSTGTPAEGHAMPSPNRLQFRSAKRPAKEVLGPGSISKRPRLDMSASRADFSRSRVFVANANMSNAKQDGGPCFGCGKTETRKHWHRKISGADRTDEGKHWCDMCYKRDLFNAQLAKDVGPCCLCGETRSKRLLERHEDGMVFCSSFYHKDCYNKKRQHSFPQMVPQQRTTFRAQAVPVVGGVEDARPAAAVVAVSTNIGSTSSTPIVLASQDVPIAVGVQDASPAATRVVNSTNIGSPWSTSNVIASSNIPFAQSGRVEKDGGPCFSCGRTQSRNWLRKLNEEDPPGDGTVWCHKCYSVDSNKKIKARRKAEANGLAGQLDTVKAQMDAAQDRYFELRDEDALDDVVDAQNRVVRELRTRYKQLQDEINEAMGRGR